MRVDNIKNGSREILSLAMAAQNRGFIDASERLLDLYEVAKKATAEKIDCLYKEAFQIFVSHVSRPSLEC